jgi:VanZ family protein
MRLRYPNFPLQWAWFLWISWTVMLSYLLLWPSEGTPVRQISLFFGGDDVTDAIGHLILVFVETNLTYSVLRHYIPQEQAFRRTLLMMLLFGFITESLQLFIPGRGAALIDYGANALGVGMLIPVFYLSKRFSNS